MLATFYFITTILAGLFCGAGLTFLCTTNRRTLVKQWKQSYKEPIPKSFELIITNIWPWLFWAVLFTVISILLGEKWLSPSIYNFTGGEIATITIAFLSVVIAVLFHNFYYYDFVQSFKLFTERYSEINRPNIYKKYKIKPFEADPKYLLNDWQIVRLSKGRTNEEMYFYIQSEGTGKSIFHDTRLFTEIAREIVPSLLQWGIPPVIADSLLDKKYYEVLSVPLTRDLLVSLLSNK
jgi:hypothetical protein